MRLAVIVIDSFGIGALPDADEYGDEGANTALHICEAERGGLWPNLAAMGLWNAARLVAEGADECPSAGEPTASFGVMGEQSPGKDTTTGHWELMGVVLDEAFRTFPASYPSFPDELISAFERRTGRRVLGNRAASGTVIIQELGDEHVRTGKPIVYTSSDSVFQIAAHESVIPVDELYSICETARELCDSYRIGRVIARPFVGSDGTYTRTAARRDFSMEPSGETLLDRLSSHGIETVGVGKIGDIFVERGLVKSHHDKGNGACLERTNAVLSAGAPNHQFVFVNLVDTDMVYGHRRDVRGYADAVSEIDAAIPGLIAPLDDHDILVITADHGCDPTFRGTDHTREYVPLLWYERGRPSEHLGIRTSFADLAQTIAAGFGVGAMSHGRALFER